MPLSSPLQETRLRRKEDAINDWEMQQTGKATDHMDKIQNELERKQLMASARAQKIICLVREKAEKQKLNLRRSTMKKFQRLQKSEIHSPSDPFSIIIQDSLPENIPFFK